MFLVVVRCCGSDVHSGGDDGLRAGHLQVQTPCPVHRGVERGRRIAGRGRPRCLRLPRLPDRGSSRLVDVRQAGNPTPQFRSSPLDGYLTHVMCIVQHVEPDPRVQRHLRVRLDSEILARVRRRRTVHLLQCLPRRLYHAGDDQRLLGEYQHPE